METPIVLSLEATDVGSTIALTLKVNGEKCISWMAQTRHSDYAIENGIDEVKELLRKVMLYRLDTLLVSGAELRLEGKFDDDWDSI
jgi:hypothetical protein